MSKSPSTKTLATDWIRSNLQVPKPEFVEFAIRQAERKREIDSEEIREVGVEIRRIFSPSSPSSSSPLEVKVFQPEPTTESEPAPKKRRPYKTRKTRKPRKAAKETKAALQLRKLQKPKKPDAIQTPKASVSASTDFHSLTEWRQFHVERKPGSSKTQVRLDLLLPDQSMKTEIKSFRNLVKEVIDHVNGAGGTLPAPSDRTVPLKRGSKRVFASADPKHEAKSPSDRYPAPNLGITFNLGLNVRDMVPALLIFLENFKVDPSNYQIRRSLGKIS